MGGKGLLGDDVGACDEAAEGAGDDAAEGEPHCQDDESGHAVSNWAMMRTPSHRTTGTALLLPIAL